jgi:membrane associated rhomboid family serine protease
VIQFEGPAVGLIRSLERIRHARVSWCVVILLLCIQTWMRMLAEPMVCYEAFGLSRGGFAAGKAWQVFTHGFIHGGWWHAGWNALFVLLLGSRLEQILGSAIIWRVMAAGVLGGGVVHLAIGTGLLVGFSGACMALLLLLTTISPQSRMMPLPLSARSLGCGMFIASLLLALMNPALGVPFFSEIGLLIQRHGMASWFQLGHACHLGGAIVGWLFGRWILRPRVTLASLQRERLRRGQD